MLRQLVHNGVVVPASPGPYNVTLNVRGRPVALTPPQEEMALAWARKLGTPYAEDQVFASNFAADFSAALGAQQQSRQRDSDCALGAQQQARQCDSDCALGAQQQSRQCDSDCALRAQQQSRQCDSDCALGIEPPLKLQEVDFGPAVEIIAAERAARERLSREERKAQAAQRKAAREALKRMNGPDMTRFDKIIMGHWHAPLEHPYYWIGGSVSGTDAHDHQNGRQAEPQQVAWMVHPKWGEFDRTCWKLRKFDEEAK